MRPKTSNLGLTLFLFSFVVGATLYLADLSNVPVISNWMDYLGSRIYAWVPVLGRLIPPAKGSMIFSAGLLGLILFLLATIAAAPFMGNSTSEGQLEKRLRNRGKSKRGSSVKVS
jgi:hypothetical protein